jgi:hypothetical protein
VWLAPLVVDVRDGRVQHHAERRDGGATHILTTIIIATAATPDICLDEHYFVPPCILPPRNKPAVAGSRSATSQGPTNAPFRF